MAERGKDLTGMRFGWLVAVRPTGERRNGSVVWECKCDCGNTTYEETRTLCSNRKKSCGCMRSGKKTADLTGQRVGRLTVLRLTEKRRKGGLLWECKCDCGNTAFVPATALRTGNTKSCGCGKITPDKP